MLRISTLFAMAFALLIACLPDDPPEKEGATPATTQGGSEAEAQDGDTEGELRKRGEYLTHHVAMCVVCHSPKDEQGNVIAQKRFSGAPIPVASPYKELPWASRAPNLRGGGSHSKEDLIELLTTGSDSHGFNPRPPMPEFRLTMEDAEAIADYLNSVR